jgi:hypothetical protein
MQTPSPEPLLDEADFLAELVNLDPGLTATQRTPLPSVERKVFDPFPGLSLRVAAPEPERHVETTGEPDAPSSIMWRVTAAAMFVLMMGVGAAGAAAVFHDRVERIVTNLAIHFP